MLSIVGAKFSEVELDGGPIMLMFALGQKQTCAAHKPMSAKVPIVDSGPSWTR
jgi:hypothetical protein